jgi:hexokinase
VVKQVKISDFKPSTRTVERENLVRVVSEFREFLEKQLITDDTDSRPMIQLE